MECPRCKGSIVLKDVIYEERGVKARGHRCPRCEGHFFTRADLNAISDVPVQDKVKLDRIPGAFEQLYELTCPNCAHPDPMLKAQSRKEKSVTMDVCGACGGIWLDGGELEAIRGEASSIFQAARDWIKNG